MTITDGTTHRPWIRARIAHPVRDLAASVSFYRDLLHLPPAGGFTGHDGYDGAFLGLPGGAELELTVHDTRTPSTDDDLLVLYVGTRAELQAVAGTLQSAGVPTVPSANPYWGRWGETLLDPDGNRVVIAVGDPEGPPHDLRIAPFAAPREDLSALFELAEDSPTELASYLHAGRVLVAVSADEVIGHLQLVDTGTPGQVEIKNMAVRETYQGRGIGRRLVTAAIDLASGEPATTLVVATAAADIGNLRFYQRLGFRFRSVERDAFTAATGYPPGLRLDGIELRDRVWLDRPLAREQCTEAGP
jgi:ribosomal protein S18 acetylase RimI-like enzyme